MDRLEALAMGFSLFGHIIWYRIINRYLRGWDMENFKLSRTTAPL